jgi:hypothetical protein
MTTMSTKILAYRHMARKDACLIIWYAKTSKKGAENTKTVYLTKPPKKRNAPKAMMS